MMNIRILLMVALTAWTLQMPAAKFADVPAAALQNLKGARGKPIRSGVVFVNGRYLPPPYVVWRRGTAIFIGDVQATGQIVPWSVFEATPDESARARHLKRIMDYRTDIDRRLRRNEVLFFGANHAMLHVEERLGVSLMSALPGALRECGDVDSLQSRLRTEGITYLGFAICEDLFAKRS